jgi:BASS family bile acid:Na+ symporter
MEKYGNLKGASLRLPNKKNRFAWGSVRQRTVARKISLMWWRNRNVLLILSIIVALPAGKAAPYLEPLVLPALALVMTMALLEVSGASFRSARGLMVPVLAGLGLNFGINGGLVLALSLLLSPGEAIFTGFVLVAAAPPAVAVVPFTALLRGDRAFAFLGTIGCYLGALVITPLMAVGLLGAAFIQPLRIFWILVMLILLPLLLSRLVRRAHLVDYLEPIRGALTNWSFALITFTIVGLNRELFLHDPGALLTPMIIALISTFGLGWAISGVAKLLGLGREITVSLVMLGTLKNAALAGGLALSLFNKQTAVPATVCAIFLVGYFIWLSFWEDRSRELPKAQTAE